MARYDFRTPRLYVEPDLKDGASVPLAAAQAHYLFNVLRLKPEDAVLAFNGRHGEWQARLAGSAKRNPALVVGEQSREQTAPNDLHYLFAPLKHERLDYMVQKAVELGVSRLQPVMTRRTQASRVNVERMRANAIEAAEQCGVLAVPEIGDPLPLERALASRKTERLLVFCDEDAETGDAVAALAEHRVEAAPSALVPIGAGEGQPMMLAVLVGPEGGFSDDERAALLKDVNVLRLSLGPRILRADTAAVAALTLVQAVLGDWRSS